MMFSFQRAAQFAMCVRITSMTNIRHWFINRPILLGRWNLTYQPHQIEEKVRRSNEDNSL